MVVKGSDGSSVCQPVMVAAAACTALGSFHLAKPKPKPSTLYTYILKGFVLWYASAMVAIAHHFLFDAAEACHRLVRIFV